MRDERSKTGGRITTNNVSIRLFLSTAEHGTEVLHQQHEVEFKAGTPLESVSALEGRDLGVDGKHEDGTAADDLRTPIRPLQGVF